MEVPTTLSGLWPYVIRAGVIAIALLILWFMIERFFFAKIPADAAQIGRIILAVFSLIVIIGGVFGMPM